MHTKENCSVSTDSVGLWNKLDASVPWDECWKEQVKEKEKAE